MRVPPQRSSRSNTAPSGGKRISTSSSTSNAASSSGKKRKLHSDSSTKPTHKQSPDASTSNTGSKRKPSLPNVRKTTYHPKRADTASSTKNPKSDSGIKKSQTRKSISIPLVGLKKIKIKEGKVTVKKILMTAAATKSQKKIVKSSVKCTPSKKSVTGGNKKTAGTSTSSVEAVSTSSTGELQAASSSSVGRTSGESEDQNPSQKKTQCRNPASSKFNTKKTKVIIKKSKAPSITSVPVPLTRTKKLQQTQNLKSVKKICLKKYPATKQVMVQQATIGKKKKIITRKKNTTGENSGNGEGQVTQKSNESPSSNQNEGQSSASADNVQSGANVSATQSAEKGSGKGNTKKAKDEESAIKKSDKKKIVKKKPKMEDSGKGSTAVSEEAPSEIISETTKEETVASPKKENKNDSKDETATKGKCVKKSKAIPSESSAVKGKSTKKPPIVKSVKVISTKLKKITDSKPSNSKVKKVQQPKKKIPKSSVKKIVAKEQLPIDTKQEVSEGKERKPPKNTESNDEDSSTSDEITLDVLLMRQQMKQENITSDDTSPEQQTASEPCSPVSSTEKLSSPQDIENKSYIPLMSSVKVEESAPSSTVATLSPATVNTSDDEDLKSIKNKIKIKLEESNTDDGKKSPAMPDKTSKKKSVATKSKTSDSSASRSKYVGTSIKKEPKDDSDKSEKKKSESDSKSSSDKDRPKKVLGVKKSATGVKRTRSESGKNGSSGSDTEQRARRMKLFGFWSGIKRHRVASLNALAKVHCLYENESRGALLGLCGASSNSSPRAPKSTPAPVNVSTEVTVTTTRTLRSAPGLRGMGKHWDMHNASSTSSSSTSSDENESNSDSATSTPPPSYKQKRRQQKVTTTTTTSSSSCGIKKKTTKQIKNLKKVVKRRRNRCELMMDLKDMVVRKRMASLNASAILAASYSVEKRPAKTNKDETGVSGDAESSANNAQQGKKKTKKRLVTKKIVEVEDDSSSISSDVEVEECDLEGRGSSRSVIEVRTTPSGGGSSNKKVAVILNQDTDVTITGVYVNSTTRSTHHEGFCSIAGMQYRISSTSHTQTEATAVATETVLHTSTAAEHPPPQHHPAEPPLAAPIKSYTPLGALSNMQPPGSTVVGGPPPHHHHHPHPHPHPHSHPPPCNVPPQQPPPPPPHRGPVNPPAHPPISPLGRRHGCSSAFSAPPPPPTATYGPPPQHPQPPHHHPPHPPPQGQQDPAYMHGYYQPAGPLISTHHHHHSSSSSSSSSITNTGKVPPAVLPTLEASPNPTPPPSATGHSGPVSVPTSSTTAIAPPVPQQLVSATSSGSGGGGARSGGDESDNDVIITATSCSGGGEVAPPPPVPQPLPLQQHPHQASYRYPQSYPPPPTPSTPQHIHHQSYTYNYPHTQYYPSPPSSASIQYSAVATNPPSLQQHHTHYHNQDLCYSSSASYPPASYFHHKSYSTPPPSSYRRYIPPPHPAQYYTSDLYSSPASNASQQNSGQSQQSQQMVVTGSSAGSASSYQPPAAPPPPPLVGVSSNPPPPPLVDSFPPPVSIVDPYPPPAYYTGYSAGPGAAGCYAHSSPTRSLAFIDAAYQSCPCPMQSCPKNVHTGPLTGDGKGPHITTKQQQPQPVQESGASFHQLPLPPVALALPLEPPGALGPPSPARGSAGMPPPPSPATASARNPSHAQEEAAFQQRGWELDVTGTGAQSKLEATSKQEPVVQDYVGETKLMSTLDSAQDLQSKPDKEFSSDTTTLPSDEAVGKTDISRHRLLAISKVVSPTDGILCRTNKKKSPTAINNVPLLMCDVDFQKRHISSEVVLTKPEDITIVDTKMVNNSVKLEVRNLEKEVFVDNSSSQGVVQNGSKTIFRNGSSRKRKIQPGSDTTTTTTKAETDTSVPKRRNLSTSNGDTSRLSVSSQESQKTDGGSEAQDQVNSVPLETQTKCKNGQKMQPLSSNSCSLHNAKNNVRKRKLDDADLTENKEPQTVPSKKKGLTKPLKEQRLQTKIYPSRMKQMKKIVASKDGETMKKVDEVVESVVAKGRTILEPLSKRNISSNVAPLSKKTPGNKSIDRKKSETKINGVLSQQKKPSLRHQAGKHEPPSCLNGLNRVTQTNASRARMEGKKVYQRKKSEHSSLSGRVNHMLRSHSLRDSLSDHSSDDADSNTPRGKASSCPSSQNPSSISTVRRASTGSRKDQSKKPGPPVRNDGASSLKKQTQQQHAGSQDMATVVTLLSRKIAPKKPLQQSPKWSNGWKFEGDPFESKVFLSSDDVLVSRKCYPLMRHEEGDVICPRDCILLKSGPRKTDLPFVAKVAALWENPDDGEMMVSLLWYYRPEHTDHGRRPDDMEDEIFASKHKDINSVACIEDKCYVLTFNEYCRYRKCVRRLEDGVREPGLVVPQHHGYPRENRQPPGCVAPELVFFCRRVYDFRQRRILKNPG